MNAEKTTLRGDALCECGGIKEAIILNLKGVDFFWIIRPIKPDRSCFNGYN